MWLMQNFVDVLLPSVGQVEVALDGIVYMYNIVFRWDWILA
jgi:hypothetical protein